MIKIYGASDDLVEVEGCEGADEFVALSNYARAINWRGDLIAPDGSAMRVMAWYGPGGVWLIGVGQVDEDKLLPAWPLRIRQAEMAECSYSVVLELDAPEGTRIEVPEAGK